MSYIQRHIDVTFRLGKGSFGESGFDTVKLSGLRVSAVIEILGRPSLSRSNMRIYGMTLSMMNQLSRAGMIPTAQRNNVVAIHAGDFESGMGLVYQGTLGNAFQDLQNAPDVFFSVSAWTGLFNNMKPVAPSSYPGSASVAVIMASLAKQMNYNFKNYGVNVVLANPYFPGTAMAQMAAVADAANIYAFIENDETLVIVPKDGARGDDIPVISVDTGMIGYPNAIAPGWISLRTIYNPTIRFMGQIKVQSSISAVNGLWRVRRMTHSLESEMPNGQWETDIDASLFDRPGISLNG